MENNKVIIISPFPSHPVNAGNRSRVVDMGRRLRRLGFSVSYIHLDMEEGDEDEMEKFWRHYYKVSYRKQKKKFVKRNLDKLLGVINSNIVFPYFIDDWFDDACIPQLEEIVYSVNPACVIVEYVYLSKIFKILRGDFKKVIDTHDVFSGRHRIYSKNLMPPVFFYTTKWQEIKGLNRADSVVAIQSKELEYFRNVSSCEVIKVGSKNYSGEMVNPLISDSKNIVFVGSGNDINIHAVKWFLEEVFPLVRRKVPGVKFQVYGNCSHFYEGYDDVSCQGFCSEIEAVYRNASVIVNPVQFGTGLNIKSVEAISSGVPLVASRVGAEGLECWSGVAFLQGEDATSFAYAVVKSLTSAELRGRLFSGARKFVAEYELEIDAALVELVMP